MKVKSIFFFYELEVEKEIQERYESVSGDDIRIGVLLDTMLTLDDIEGTLRSFYPSTELAKRIYFEFKNRIPIYIITSNTHFEKQCERIMGVDLSRQHILKSNLLQYEIAEDFERMFSFYEEYYKEDSERDRELN